MLNSKPCELCGTQGLSTWRRHANYKCTTLRLQPARTLMQVSPKSTLISHDPTCLPAWWCVALSIAFWKVHPQDIVLCVYVYACLNMTTHRQAEIRCCSQSNDAIDTSNRIIERANNFKWWKGNTEPRRLASLYKWKGRFNNAMHHFVTLEQIRYDFRKFGINDLLYWDWGTDSLIH